MSSERKDLVAICDRLGVLNQQEATNKTDCELLRSIVSTLKHVQSSEAKTQMDEQVKIRLKQESLPDSLAFPASHRQRSKLVEATDNWDGLKKINDLLKQDHTCRRQMLLNRLDCTIESFKWKASENLQHMVDSGGDQDEKKPPTNLNDLIHEKYDEKGKELREEPQVSISHLLAVREGECDRLLNCVVSTKNVDCQVAYKQRQKQSHDSDRLVNLKQIIIPDVPDRGGRPEEVRVPSKESFYQQNRGRGRGGGGRR